MIQMMIKSYPMATHWINYHHLYYFKHIAELGSISKAAEKLRLGQPTLSAQLKQFEDTLGVKLFEREHKKLTLTEQGKIALTYATSIFSMGGELLEVLHDRHIPMRTHLHIGAVDSVPKQLLLEITKFAYQNESCSIGLSEGRNEEMLRDLQSHKLDLFITNILPVSGNLKGLRHRILFQDTVGIYGAPQFKQLKKNFPKSLNSKPFIYPTFDSRLRYDVEHWFYNQQVNVDIIAESQDIAVKKIMAIEGLGLIAAGEHSVLRQIKSGELIEIGKLRGVSESLYLLSAERKVANKLAQVVFKNFAY
jgi:LysR family transcriptional activator of nhaA